MSNQTDKKEYCAADQLGTVCYHQSSELCQLCKRSEDDRKRLSQEIGIPITKRSRRWAKDTWQTEKGESE